jgi:hypothetical protein
VARLKVMEDDEDRSSKVKIEWQWAWKTSNNQRDNRMVQKGSQIAVQCSRMGVVWKVKEARMNESELVAVVTF